MITKNQVKYIQSLSQKKLRDTENRFVAEGPKVVAELLEMPQLRLHQLYGTEEWFSGQRLHAMEAAVEVSEAELARISFLQTPNQVLAVFEKPVWTRPRSNWTLLLDGIQDPGNMGTIIRIADWFGIHTIVCSEDSADAFSPKVVQSTMASIGRVELVYRELAAFMEEHPEITYYGAVLGGKDYTLIKPRLPAALVIGNESKGIRPPLADKLNQSVTIPRRGSAESLNAAVATGILLAHFCE